MHPSHAHLYNSLQLYPDCTEFERITESASEANESEATATLSESADSDYDEKESRR